MSFVKKASVGNLLEIEVSSSTDALPCSPLNDADLFKPVSFGFSRSESEVNLSLGISQALLRVPASPRREAAPKRYFNLRLSASSARAAKFLLTLLVVMNLVPIAAAATFAAVVNSPQFGQAMRHAAPVVGRARTPEIIAPAPDVLAMRWATFNRRAEELASSAVAAATDVEREARVELSRLSVQLQPLAHGGGGADGGVAQMEGAEAAAVPHHAVGLAATLWSTYLASTHEDAADPSSSSDEDEAWGVGTEAEAEALAAAAVAAAGRAVPDGLDVGVAVTCAELCGFTYHSCDPRGADGAPTHTARLIADLHAEGLVLVREVYSEELDTYAVIAQSDTDVYLTFRGTCTARNVLTDLDYLPADEAAIAHFAAESGLHLPAGMTLHSGFLAAWRSLRSEVRETLDEVVAHRQLPGSPMPSRGLSLRVGGHSMGGAMAMLASLELAADFHARGEGNPFAAHTTYTFAAPRLGNAAFARLYDQSFPDKSDHWALQLANDAVCHLPFAAWGFRHPHGIAVLDGPTALGLAADDASADTGAGALEGPYSAEHYAALAETEAAAPAPPTPSAPPRVVGRMGDPGDNPQMLKPRDGKVVNWAAFHLPSAYLAYLRPLAEVGGGLAAA